MKIHFFYKSEIMTHSIDSLHPGNTSTGCRIRSRCWFITSFNDPLKHFENAKFECWCDDLTEENKYHFHQVVVFENQVYFNTIKKSYPTANIQKPKSDVYKCIQYVKGEIHDERHVKTNYQSIGEEPKNTRFKTVADLKDCNEPDLLDWKQYNTYMKIHENDEIDVDEMFKEVVVYYISGPSGAGKTERAKQIIRENKEKYGSKVSIVKYEGNFWHGVGSNRNVALYDDFRDSHMKPSEFINFIDYNKHYMNVKGGNCVNDYKLIIITSVQPLDEIYRNVSEEPRKQWIRRITEIHLEDDNDEIDLDAL